MGVSEVPVALVLARDSHDGPGSVCHKHVVGQEKGNRRASERVHHEGPGGHPALVEGALGGESVDLRATGDLGPECLDGLPSVLGG